MNRFYLSFSLLAVCFLGAFGVSGCKAPTVGYQISQFSSLRVMDFAPYYGENCTPTSAMDAYWYPVGQSRSTLANAYGLSYGEASVYTNLIPAGNYNVLLTEHLVLDSTDLKTTITLAPNQKYTLLVTRSSTGLFGSSLIQDGVPNPAPNLAYVRFINMQPNAGSLTVHVNDPVTGELINATPLAYDQVGQYVTIQTAEDTSYAFFVTNTAGQVLARLSYQTFSGGSCYTLVYAGDLCETRYTSIADSTESALDTLRLRAFDDNSLGYDLTNPISPAFRFNIVNDIIPNVNPYSSSYPTDNSIGYVVNGQSFPEFYNFTIPPVPTYQGGGENVAAYESDGVTLDVNYQSLITPTQLVVTGSATTPTGTNQQILFTAGIEAKLNEANIVNNPNKPFTFIFYDTAPPPSHPNWLDTSLSGSAHYAIVLVPDTSSEDTATLLFIAGIVNEGANTSTKNNTLFYVSNNGGAAVPPALQPTTGITTGLTKILQVPMTAATQLTVFDSIGSKAGSGNRVPGNSTTFTAQPGGIYEIVSVGIKTDPHLLIMHVNSNQP